MSNLPSVQKNKFSPFKYTLTTSLSIQLSDGTKRGKQLKSFLESIFKDKTQVICKEFKENFLDRNIHLKPIGKESDLFKNLSGCFLPDQTLKSPLINISVGLLDETNEEEEEETPLYINYMGLTELKEYKKGNVFFNYSSSITQELENTSYTLDNFFPKDIQENLSLKQIISQKNSFTDYFKIYVESFVTKSSWPFFKKTAVHKSSIYIEADPSKGNVLNILFLRNQDSEKVEKFMKDFEVLKTTIQKNLSFPDNDLIH